MEYAWKFFKRHAEDEGVEIFSPKDAVRAAAASNLIDDPEIWIRFINDRNLSVHDYLGIDDEEYMKSIKQFVEECERLQVRWKDPNEKSRQLKKKPTTKGKKVGNLKNQEGATEVR